MKKFLLILFLNFIAFANSQTLIRKYTFNNTYYDTSNVEFFKNTYSNSNAGFGIGRDGNANTGIDFSSGKAMYSSISNLPIGSSARSISLWIKLKNISSTQTIYFYGIDSSGKSFGLTYNSNNSLELFNWGSSVIVSNTNFITTNWYHIVATYDGTSIKIYINGNLVKTQAFTLNTSNSIFRLGDTSNLSSVANLQAIIDDLEIYSGALSDSQVSSLYQFGNLATQDFNQNNLKVTTYPNPVKDILNIEMETTIKSAEIYDIQGKKLKESSTKAMNLSSLPKGNYILKITDKTGKTETKKIIKE